MSLSPRLLVVASLLLAVAAPAMAQAPLYRVVKQVPLGPPERWDLLAFDASANRIYVSHATEVTAVDAGSGTVVGHVPGLDTSHGIVTVPELNRGYADSGKTQTAVVFDLKTLKPLATLAAGEDADAMTYDTATHRVFVMDADGAAFTAIDAAQNKSLATVALGGKPESAIGDGAGHVFANLASTNELVRIDAAALKVDRRWPLTGCESPHGLAIDTDTHRLFVSCENQVLQVVSSDDGKRVASLPIGKYTDAAAFDPKRKRAFSSNGDGTLSIVAEHSAGAFEALPPVTTMPGARTMTLDPATGRLFLVAAGIDHVEPATEPGRPPHPVYVPGSAKLLILEPADR